MFQFFGPAPFALSNTPPHRESGPAQRGTVAVKRVVVAMLHRVGAAGQRNSSLAQVVLEKQLHESGNSFVVGRIDQARHHKRGLPS